MGQRGSDVTREVADLVLLDDNFATIVVAIEEGRSIYENIQKFIRFLFSTNLSEVLVVTLGAFAAFLIGLRDDAGKLFLPLTAAQLLWINLVTDGAPALALGLDRNPGVMTRPPRDPRSPLLDRHSRRTDLRPPPNPYVHVAVLLGFLAQIVVIGAPDLRQAFDTVPLPVAAWLWVGASVVVSWSFAELASRLVWFPPGVSRHEKALSSR